MSSKRNQSKKFLRQWKGLQYLDAKLLHRGPISGLDSMAFALIVWNRLACALTHWHMAELQSPCKVRAYTWPGAKSAQDRYLEPSDICILYFVNIHLRSVWYTRLI
jgi:hypothetical protein